MVENNGLIPNHQLGFRQRHSTIKQTYRVIRRINADLENKPYCSAAFLSAQAFDISYTLQTFQPHQNLWQQPLPTILHFWPGTVIETLLCRNCHTHLLVIQNWFKNGE
jgi:hypothetical protein